MKRTSDVQRLSKADGGSHCGNPLKALMWGVVVVGVVVGLAAAATLTVLLSSPSVARGAEPVEVRIADCTGSLQVPAGAEIVVSGGWLAHKRGLVRAYLSAAEMFVSVDGTPVANANDLYGPIVNIGDWDGDGDSEFATFWSLTLGALEAGQSHELDWSAGLTRRITDGGDYDGDGRPDWFGPGENLWSRTCTLIATP